MVKGWWADSTGFPVLSMGCLCCCLSGLGPLVPEFISPELEEKKKISGNFEEMGKSHFV